MSSKSGWQSRLGDKGKFVLAIVVIILISGFAGVLRGGIDLIVDWYSQNPLVLQKSSFAVHSVQDLFKLIARILIALSLGYLLYFGVVNLLISVIRDVKKSFKNGEFKKGLFYVNKIQAVALIVCFCILVITASMFLSTKFDIINTLSQERKEIIFSCLFYPSYAVVAYVLAQMKFFRDHLINPKGPKGGTLADTIRILFILFFFGSLVVISGLFWMY